MRNTTKGGYACATIVITSSRAPLTRSATRLDIPTRRRAMGGGRGPNSLAKTRKNEIKKQEGIVRVRQSNSSNSNRLPGRNNALPSRTKDVIDMGGGVTYEV